MAGHGEYRGMIAKYINSLPGSKEYLHAQRVVYMAFGSFVTFMLSIFGALIANIPPTDTEGAITRIEFFVGILALMFIIIGLIVYYYCINKANIKYVQEGKN